MPAEYLREEEDFEEDTLFDQAGLLTNKIKQRSDIRNANNGIRITPMKTFALCLAFFGLGLSTAILEPTLLDLQHLAATDVQHISYTITARSAGFILGSILGFLLFERYNRQFLLFLVMLAIAILLGVLPWCHNLVAYIVILIFLGALMQMLQAGGNVLCLDLWGRQSGPFLQAIHFSMALGLFIAPFLSNAILASKAGVPVRDETHVIKVNDLHALALPASTLFGVQITTANGKQHRRPREVNLNDTITESNVTREHYNGTPVSAITDRTSFSENESSAVTTTVSTVATSTTNSTSNSTLNSTLNSTSNSTSAMQSLINNTATKTQASENSTLVTTITPTTGNTTETSTISSKSSQNDTNINSTESTAKTHKPKPSIIDGSQLKHDDKWARTKEDIAGAVPVPVTTSSTPTSSSTVTTLTLNSTTAITTVNNSANVSTTTLETSTPEVHEEIWNSTNKTVPEEPLTSTISSNLSYSQTSTLVNVPSTTDIKTTTSVSNNITIIPTTIKENLVQTTNSTPIPVTNDQTTTPEIITATSDVTIKTTSIADSVSSTTTKNETSTIDLVTSTKTSQFSTTIIDVTERGTEPIELTEETTSITVQDTSPSNVSVPAVSIENSTNTNNKTTTTNVTMSNSTIPNNSDNNDLTVDDDTLDGSSQEDALNFTIHRKPYTFNNQSYDNQLLLTDFFNKITELGVTKVHIVYMAMAVIVLLTSVVFLSFLCHNPRELRSKQKGADTDCVNEGKFASVLTAILFIFMMFYTGAELIFSQLYLSLVLQSGAHLLRSRGNLLISVFWGVYTFSRGTSICCTNGFKPATMLLLDLSCCTVSATTLVIFGPQVESILWCSVAIMAIGLSSILPYSLLWLEDYIHISNKTACAILLGNAVVHLVLSFVYGRPISLASSVVIYLVLACCVFALLLFGVAWRLATWRGDKYKTSKSNVRYQLANQVDDDEDNVEMAAGSSSLYLLNNETSHSNSDNLYFSLKQKKNVWK